MTDSIINNFESMYLMVIHVKFTKNSNTVKACADDESTGYKVLALHAVNLSSISGTTDYVPQTIVGVESQE